MVGIKLMADYECSPLWWHEKDKVGNIAPEDLPLQADTIERLYKWAKCYDATLNWDDPVSSAGFAIGEAEDAFEQEGILLWKRLQGELRSEYEVVYFSDCLNQLLDSKSDVSLASPLLN